MGFHRNAITRGVYGEISKVREELEEAEDAIQQGQTLMLLVELAERFNITGAPYTVLCTLVATPRALVPLLEHMRMPFPHGEQCHGKGY